MNDALTIPAAPWWRHRWPWLLMAGPAVVLVAGSSTSYLAHATQPEKDIRLALKPDRDGYFTASLPLLERSRWTVLVEDEQRAWRLEGHWEWPQQREVSAQADTQSADL